MPDKLTPRLPIDRKPLFEYDDVLSRYWHPNGWVITQHQRDWDLRGYPRGGGHGTSLHEAPKRYWEVKRRNVASRSRHPVETFLTLREAREWCDQHKGWRNGNV